MLDDIPRIVVINRRLNHATAFNVTLSTVRRVIKTLLKTSRFRAIRTRLRLALSPRNVYCYIYYRHNVERSETEIQEPFPWQKPNFFLSCLDYV